LNRDDGRATPADADIALTAADGVPLIARLWTSPSPRGTLVVAHGFGEHGGSYRHLADVLTRGPGLDVLACDFRGHGRSGGRRGVVRRHADLTLDLAAALDWAAVERPGRPVFLLGHSNGGLVAINAVLGRDWGLAGLILSNPSLRLITPVPAWKRALGQVLDRVAPWVTLDSGIPDGQLTRDPAALAAIAADPLRHNRISPPLFFGMVDAGPVAVARAAEIRLPTLMVLGGADPIVDPAVGRRFFDGLGSADKTLRLYPEMRHEPLNELGREGVIAEVGAWLGARLP